MAHLSLFTSENKVDILLIQEPYCHEGVPLPDSPRLYNLPSPIGNKPQSPHAYKMRNSPELSITPTVLKF
jgi:hypothetical protein